MDDTTFLDPRELGGRQQLAAARRQREGQRLATLARLVDTQRRADELRNWMNAWSRFTGDHSYPELQRMIGWARAQLEELESSLTPGQVSAFLKERDLFPEVDPLNDPLGEPPQYRIWGHSAALRPIEAS